MKWIVASILLICLLGGASAQTMFTGEGYSSSQLAFFSSPNTASFEPNVEKYWGTYITGAENVTTVARNPATTMNVWMNAFPINFNSPLQFKSTSFSTSAPTASGIGQNEMNSMLLRRDINYKFNVDQSWKYNTDESSFALAQSKGTPTSDASGQILSQGIISLFNI